jgi:hypothetical protein
MVSQKSRWMSSPSSDILGPWSHGSSFHWCLPVSPDVSSQTSILSGLLVQSCPCLVPDNSVPYAVQEWHIRSSLHRRWPTSSGTHHCPGSISSAFGDALQLDVSSRVASCIVWRYRFLLRSPI